MTVEKAEEMARESWKSGTEILRVWLRIFAMGDVLKKIYHATVGIF